MTSLCTLVSLLLFLQALFLLWNLRSWHRLQKAAGPPGEMPLVSVLIPARNEETRIGACLQHLQLQTWQPLEIIVYDDQSEDGTAWIVRQFGRADSRIRLLRGTRLPEQAFGKGHACQQAAAVARGDWLLFLDADTTAAPALIERLMRTAEQRNSDLLTGFPRVVNKTMTGWLVTSLMAFVVAMHLPISLVERSPDPKFVAANGALMLFRRRAYDQIGGHAAAGQHLVEDMMLAKTVKRSGLRVTLAEVSDVISVDMYDRARDVWLGYSKNLYAGLGRSPLLLAGVALYYFALFVLPWLLLWTDLRWLAPALAGVLLKGVIDRRTGVPVFVSCGMPVSAMLLILIGLFSGYRSWSGLGYSWKGRMYS